MGRSAGGDGPRRRARRRRAARARRRGGARRARVPGRACARWRRTTSATVRGSSAAAARPASTRPRSSSRASGRLRSAQHAPMEPHACLAEWQDGRLTVWTGTQTPFNVRRELAGTFAPRRGATSASSRRRWAARFGAKTFTRIEAIAAALARKRRPPGQARALARRALPHAQPPSDALAGAPRRHARRHASWPAACGRSGTPAPMPTPARTSPPKGGWAAVGPYRFDHVEVDARLRLHEPPEQRGVPRLCRHAGGLGIGAVRRPARRAARRRSARAAPAERAARRRPLRDGRGRCTTSASPNASSPRRGGSAGRPTGAARALRADEGHADAEPRRGPHRARRRPLHGACRDRRDRPGGDRRALAARCRGAGRRAATRRHRGHRHGRHAVRHPHDVEPFDPHDGRGARQPPPRRCARPWRTSSRPRPTTSASRRTAQSRSSGRRRRGVRSTSCRRSRAQAEHAIEGGLDPDTGQGIASAHWHQGAGAVRVRGRRGDGRRRDRRPRRLGLRRSRRRCLARRAAERRLRRDGHRRRRSTSRSSSRTGYVTNANMGDYQVPAFRDVPAFCGGAARIARTARSTGWGRRRCR